MCRLQCLRRRRRHQMVSLVLIADLNGRYLRSAEAEE